MGEEVWTEEREKKKKQNESHLPLWLHSHSPHLFNSYTFGKFGLFSSFSIYLNMQMYYFIT